MALLMGKDLSKSLTLQSVSSMIERPKERDKMDAFRLDRSIRDLID